MAEATLNEAAQNLAKSVRKSSETVVNGTIAAQERNIQLAQRVLEQGISVYKQQAESATALAQALTERAADPRAAWQTWMDGAMAAQERSVQYTQKVMEQGIEALKTHAESAQAISQELLEQTRQQQEAFRALAQETFNVSLNTVFGTTRAAR
ncbi:MAG TPA: hypothetical protein VH540_27370 [Ktedonobacterales bacterium]|jgi:hypothetical protein